MNAWRMALRAGFKGTNLWPYCEKEKVAVVTFNGIYNVDLSKYSEDRKPRSWRLKGSAPGSMSNFAWHIRGGDLIYVRDSMQHNTMVALGEVQGPQGELAYRFDPRSSIRVGHTVWRHKIKVKWSKTFKEFTYTDRSPRTTVLKLTPEEIADFNTPHRLRNLEREERQTNFSNRSRMLEDTYHRYSPSMIKMIAPRHRTLANQLIDWLKETHSIAALWEQKGIDIRFDHRGLSVLAELKIAYGGDTRHAVREALGQILEYNDRPGRRSFKCWLMVLDTEPTQDDRQFVKRLREIRKLPLIIGWKSQKGFGFYPKWP